MKFIRGLKILRPSQLLLIALLCVISIIVTAYTIAAYSKATRYIYDSEGEVNWRYTPPGSFFPWPREPGMLATLSEINEIDLFIYRYLIKTWLIVIVTLSLWIATCTYIIKRVHEKM